MKISTIIDKIDDHQLFIPAFQREYVWKQDDAKQLIDSLIKDYPTGTMLLWETSSPPELKGKYQYDQKQGSVRLLLDGQQRITTLYMLITGEIPPYYTIDEIKNDTRKLYVNIESLELSYYNSNAMDRNPRWQDITNIFRGKVSAFELQAILKTSDYEPTMDTLIKWNDNINAIIRIKDREFPEQIIPVKASIRQAIDIFYKVNASGVALTDAELALAQICGYWPQARDIFKAKLEQLKEQGFAFKLDFIVYVLLGCLYNGGSDMRKLHNETNNEKIREVWEKLEEHILDYVISILRAHAFVDHLDEINSPYALIPIFVYCLRNDNKNFTDEKIRKIVKWFFYAQLRSRYASQMPQKLDKDLSIISSSNQQPFDLLLQNLSEEHRLEISPSELSGSDIRHPLFSLMRWYFKSKNAICFETGLDLRSKAGAKYQLERDHIFPFSKLKERGYGKNNRAKYALAQELTNRIILKKTRSNSESLAENYLLSVKNNFPKALALQCIPEKQELWKIENYEQFLEERRALLAKELNQFLENITTSEKSESPITIEEIIAEGESHELEFKSSLRWDRKEDILNKKLEDVVIKAIAAFANAQGGTLLIGVNDDGSISGLEADYQSLKGANRDKFELYLRNLFNEKLGKQFTAFRITIVFHKIEDKDVCQIEIAPAKAPVVIKISNKSGQPEEKLYVRSGNSSQELPLNEMGAYIKERFN